MLIHLLYITRPDKEVPLVEAFAQHQDARKTALSFLQLTSLEYGHGPLLPTISHHEALQQLHLITREKRVKVRILRIEEDPVPIPVHDKPIRAVRWRRASVDARRLLRKYL